MLLYLKVITSMSCAVSAQISEKAYTVILTLNYEASILPFFGREWFPFPVTYYVITYLAAYEAQ